MFFDRWRAKSLAPKKPWKYGVIMNKKNVWAICKDPGGTNNLLPIIEELREVGICVRVISNGHAAEVMKVGEPCVDIAKLLNDPLPGMMITSMCSGGGIGRELVPTLRSKGVTTLALQDYWGSRLGTDWRESHYRPNHICVNDQYGACLVKSAWPDMLEENVHQTGFPALDVVYGHQVPVSVNQLINAGKRGKLLVHAGQINQAGQILLDIAGALKEIEEEVTFCPRAHPRLSKNTEEYAKWNDAVGQIAKMPHITVTQWGEVKTLDVICCADLVTSAYSTALVEASCRRVPNIAVLYPEVGLARFRSEFPGQNYPPTVVMGCTGLAEDKDSLVSNLGLGLTGNAEWVEAQIKSFPGQTSAAKVVATLITKLLS